MKNKKARILFFVSFIILITITCKRSIEQNNFQENIQEPNLLNILNDKYTENIIIPERRKIKVDTSPSGSFCFIDNEFIGITPLYFELDLKYNSIRFERLRYYSEEVEISDEQIKEDMNIIVPLENENKAFTEDYYLSYSSRSQSDGIQKEFCRYIYDENAQFIGIDSYIHNEKQGFYSVNDSVSIQLRMPESERKTRINDYILEIEYGAKDSGYTKIVTEKYFYQYSTEEEKEENIKNDYLPRTIYTYQ